jgi:hypothetical protein
MGVVLLGVTEPRAAVFILPKRTLRRPKCDIAAV